MVRISLKKERLRMSTTTANLLLLSGLWRISSINFSKSAGGISGKVTQILKRLDGDGLARTAHPCYHDQLNLLSVIFSSHK